MFGALLGGCKEEPAPRAPSRASVCPPRDPAEKKPGDANGDGHVDLADAVSLREAVTARSAALPWCHDAVDVVQDELLMADDVFSLLLHLYEGAFQLPKRAELECPGTGTPPAASCATAAFTIEGGPSSARIGLVAPDLDVQGWSLSVRAEGCTIASATTAGTAGASRWSDPDGARDTGYDATFVDADGATSAVLLGLVDDVVLPSPDGVDVLALALTPEGRSCGPCELTVGAPIATLGEEVEAIVVASGARYASAPVTASFEVCAP